MLLRCGMAVQLSGEKSIGELEVLLFHSNTHSVPGSVDSVAALLHDQELVDIVIRESNTRTEWHEVKLQDTDNDGNVEVVFDCRAIYSYSNPLTISYKVSNNGFAQIK